MFLKLSHQAKRRLLIIIFSLIFIFGLFMLFLGAIRENIEYYQTPTQLIENKNNLKKKIRLGGLVVKGSISSHDNYHEFEITDNQSTIKVVLEGRLPDLFKENQGIIVLGEFLKKEKTFLAHQALVKHDQNYRPPIK